MTFPHLLNSGHNYINSVCRNKLCMRWVQEKLVLYSSILTDTGRGGTFKTILFDNFIVEYSS